MASAMPNPMRCQQKRACLNESLFSIEHLHISPEEHVEQAWPRFATDMLGHVLEDCADFIQIVGDDQADADLVQVQEKACGIFIDTVGACRFEFVLPVSAREKPDA